MKALAVAATIACVGSALAADFGAAPADYPREEGNDTYPNPLPAYREAAPPYIVGVDVSLAAFIGFCAEGRFREPTLVQSYEEFEDKFGEPPAEGLTLAHAVRGFFENRGRACYAVRVGPNILEYPTEEERAALPRKTSWLLVEGVSEPPDRVAAVLKDLEYLPDVSIVAFPGATDAAVQQVIIDHCEYTKYRFAVLDGPGPAEVKSNAPESALGLRDSLASASGHAALYYPWLEVRGGGNGGTLAVPASGHIAGILAATPLKETPSAVSLEGIDSLTYPPSKAEAEILNEAGVNCLQLVPGKGAVVRGSRTLSRNPTWRDIRIRRLMTFIERSVKFGTRWVAFRPNDEKTWAHLRANVSEFLAELWRDGVLEGATPEEAFFVRCDRTTMTEEDFAAGSVIFIVGVAVEAAGQFVTFRVKQRRGLSHVKEF